MRSHESPVTSRASRVTYLPELLILAIAALTRFWRLDYHSFWFDEAVSLNWAASDPPYTWDVTLQLVQDKHPPVYYLLLHYWQQGLGWFGLAHDDAALRALGSLLGVLMVWGLLRLATALSGRQVGLLAGALAAVAPVLVWYSQELRMFQPATTAIVWAAYFFLRATRSPAWPRRGLWWLAMIAALAAALYSYLFSAFVLPALGLLLLTCLPWGKSRVTRHASRNTQHATPVTFRLFAEGVLALGLVTLLFLPLARNAWAANAGEGAPGSAFAGFGANLLRLLQIFTVWRVDWPAPWVTAVLALAGLLVLAGLLLPWPRGNHGAADRLWLWAWIGAPLLVGNLLLARNDSIFAEDRYFLFLAPFVLWAAARGAMALPLCASAPLRLCVEAFFRQPASEDAAQFASEDANSSIALGPLVHTGINEPMVGTAMHRVRRHGYGHDASLSLPAAYLGPPVLGWLLGGTLVVLLAAALPRLWTPVMLREDWRAAVGYVTAYQANSPGLPAATVAHVDYTRLAAQWYLRQQYDQATLPLYYPFGGALAPEQAEDVVAPPLRGIGDAGADTLWLLQSHLGGVDDSRVVEGWLNQNYPLLTEQYPTGVKLSGYALTSRFAELPALAPGAVYPAVELAPGLRLAACELLTPELAATDERMHPPSGWVHVRLWWQATGPIAGDYIPTVQMVGPEGVWGDRLYRDNEALRRWPTSTWSGAEYVRDEVDVNLNPVTPPGEYPIVVGLRDGSGQETGVKAECGRVRISGNS